VHRSPGASAASSWEGWLLIVLMGFFVYSALLRGPAPATPAPDTTTARNLPPPTGIYTADEIAYFLEVGLGSEYGDARRVLRKWRNDLVVGAVGTPTPSDLEALDTVIGEILALQSSVDVRRGLGGERPNVEIVFAPERTFHEYEPNYVPRNTSFFWVQWNSAGEIHHSRILLDTALDAGLRAALLREELTQSLGLLNTSSAYPESIFNDHQGSQPAAFAPIDERLVEMIFRPELLPGIDATSIESILRTLGPRPESP
jgi:hypothetical protein